MRGGFDCLSLCWCLIVSSWARLSLSFDKCLQAITLPIPKLCCVADFMHLRLCWLLFDLLTVNILPAVNLCAVEIFCFLFGGGGLSPSSLYRPDHGDIKGVSFTELWGNFLGVAQVPFWYNSFQCIPLQFGCFFRAHAFDLWDSRLQCVQFGCWADRLTRDKKIVSLNRVSSVFFRATQFPFHWQNPHLTCVRSVLLGVCRNMKSRHGGHSHPSRLTYREGSQKSVQADQKTCCYANRKTIKFD